MASKLKCAVNEDVNKLLLTHDDQFGMTSWLKKPDTDISNMLETTNDTYYIGFGDEVHQYTFEEVR